MPSEPGSPPGRPACKSGHKESDGASALRFPGAASLFHRARSFQREYCIDEKGAETYD
jgi:hypothetical protein